MRKLLRKILLISDQKQKLFKDLNLNKKLNFEQQKGHFVTGVGRSGTHFIASLFEQSPGIKAYHMDDIGDAVGDSFTGYAKWYRLPVSSEGFLHARSFLMQQASEQKKVYLESNPMLAFSLCDLNQKFDSRFVIMVRNPLKVVESHLIKGWYKIVTPDFSNVPGYQYFHERPNHFFSRIMPVNPEERKEWFTLTRHGKVAWMWRATYERIFEQLKDMDPANFRICFLDEFTFEKYEELAKFLNTKPVSRLQFKTISESRPGKGKGEMVEWNSRNKEEFRKEVGLVLTQFKLFGFSENWQEI